MGDDYFKAVRLPSNTKVCFENFEIDSQEPIKTLEVIEIDDLNVNGKQRLVEWLPFDCTSDGVTISDSTDSGNGEILGGAFFVEAGDDGVKSIYPNNLIKFITLQPRNFKKYDFNLITKLEKQ